MRFFIVIMREALRTDLQRIRLRDAPKNTCAFGDIALQRVTCAKLFDSRVLKRGANKKVVRVFFCWPKLVPRQAGGEKGN